MQRDNQVTQLGHRLLPQQSPASQSTMGPRQSSTCYYQLVSYHWPLVNFQFTTTCQWQWKFNTSHGDKKNGGFLDVLLQGVSDSIWFFFIFLIKVCQICNVTVKESFKLIIVVSSDNHFSNYRVIHHSCQILLSYYSKTN